MAWRNNIFLVFLFWFLIAPAHGQDKFIVYFTDKEDTPFTLDQPGQYLSQRSLDRRERMTIEATMQDLPVNPAYLQSLSEAGFPPVFPSKWLNAALVNAGEDDIPALEGLPFVDRVRRASGQGAGGFGGKFGRKETNQKLAFQNDKQLQWHGIDRIHLNKNFGDEIMIAVLDADFPGVNTLPEFAHLFSEDRILMTRNFVHPEQGVYTSNVDHGTRVLSILAARREGEYMGIAPESTYLLFLTEDAGSEYRVEEYYWTVAAEKADSAGADVINSSLGYYGAFNNPKMNYTYADMDGQTTMVSRAANIAASKGILVVASAGNEGASSWEYIIAPADAPGVLTVGALTTDTIPANFTSSGPTSDGRQKPDVSSLGVGVVLINSFGNIVASSGTSFSAPVITGFAALLWQEYRELTNFELMDLIRQSGHLSANPNVHAGNGIPYVKIVLGIGDDPENVDLVVYPNPGRDWIRIVHMLRGDVYLNILDVQGRVIGRYEKEIPETLNISFLKPGIYLLEAGNRQSRYRIRLMKE